MKLSLLTLAISASSVLALPQTTPKSRALTRRLAAKHHSHHTTTLSSRDVAYNTNWAGAVYNGAPSGEHFTQVFTTFPVLNPAIPTTYSTGLSEYTASAWIGIDGSNCNNLWQAGVDSIVEKNGDVSFYAWYEWYPAATEEVNIGTIAAGDVINVNITATSSTKGTVKIDNVTTGKSFSKTVTSSDALCLGSAEWVMEDVTFGDDSTGLANFGSVSFTNSVAKTNKRTLVTADADLVDIQDDNGEYLTASSISGNTVVVKYSPRTSA